MLTSQKNLLILAGIIFGLGALALVYFGNPSNMGVCAACFVRDVSGGIGLHDASVVQYVRPEVLAFILGAFLISILTKSFNTVSSDSLFLRFILGVFVMIAALVFLGCPTRMLLRLAGGDLNALVGLFGFIVGLFIGFKFKQNKYILSSEKTTSSKLSYLLPLLAFILLAILLFSPELLNFSSKGPASQKAPILISFAIAFIIAIFAYITKFCFSGSFARALFNNEYSASLGIITMFIVVIAGNAVFGNLNISFENQPIAHNDGLFNFLAMIIVGWGSVLLIGCPFRQLIKAGSGNIDSGITIFGFLIGAAISHNFALAASPAGVSLNGKIAVGVILVLLLLITLSLKKKN